MTQHHDTGYKELFGHPEFVQPLIEGFAPPALAALLDFATLRNHSGHSITPLFDERIENVVWSVRLRPEPIGQRKPPEVFPFLLLASSPEAFRRLTGLALDGAYRARSNASDSDGLFMLELTDSGRGSP